MIRNYRHMLYTFERAYGVPIRVYRYLGNTANIESGAIEYQYQQYNAKGIILPLKVIWTMFPKDLSTGFVRRIDETEVADTGIYVSKEYLANQTVELDWLIEVGQTQYKIIEKESLDIFGWVLSCKATVAKIIGNMVSCVNNVGFGESVTHEL